MKLPYGRLIHYYIIRGYDFEQAKEELSSKFNLPISADTYMLYKDSVPKDKATKALIVNTVDQNIENLVGLRLGFNVELMRLDIVACMHNSEMGFSSCKDIIFSKYRLDISSCESIVTYLFDFDGWIPVDWMAYIDFISKYQTGSKEEVETIRVARFVSKEKLSALMDLSNLPLADRIDVAISKIMPGIIKNIDSQDPTLRRDARSSVNLLGVLVRSKNEAGGGGKEGSDFDEFFKKLHFYSSPQPMPHVSDDRFVGLNGKVVGE